MRTLLGIFCSVFLYSQISTAKICKGFGPQTPRDISKKAGKNKVKFSFAPPYDQMNLCNIHMHKNAEHKGPEFSVFAGKGKHGGYKCNMTDKLSEAELAATKATGCKDLAPGDTVEFHWVHSTCTVKPGKGLGACLSDACANPQLRVETQVYVLVNDKKAVDMMDYRAGSKRKGYYQARKVPTGDDAVQFLGSTTGPSYTEAKCSPLQVTWNVSPTCQKMDINSLHKWCKKNKFEEDHGHGVRQLVTNRKLLSKID